MYLNVQPQLRYISQGCNIHNREDSESKICKVYLVSWSDIWPRNEYLKVL